MIICKFCNDKIKNQSDAIYANKRKNNSHIDCCRKDLLMRYNEKIVEEKINHLISERNILIDEKLKKQKEKNEIKLRNMKNTINNKEVKDKFYEYIKLHYDCNLKSSFFSKVANIVNGTFKALKEGISYDDLLYMFQTKQKELDRIAYDKNTKGKGFKDSEARLNFDLVVIVNKYDSYKKWKEKQKINEIKTEDLKKINDQLIDLDNIKINNKNNQENDDVSDLLDEVF